MNQECKYCKEKFQFEKNQQFITHVASCKFNTNLKERYEKISKSFLNKRKNYKFKCKKCDNEYILNLTDYNYKNGKYSKFCCRSCANSRIHTKETLEKISNSVNEFNIKNNRNRILEEKECEFCGKKFKTKKFHRFCSKKCGDKSKIGKTHICSEEQKLQISRTRKEKFKNGELKVSGGNTNWYTVETSNGFIRVQGSYEKVTCKILDYLKSNNKIKNWEYTNDRFEYINDENKKCSYLIDFKVIKNDNTFYYLETKGYKKENDDLKWNSVKNLGFNIVVWYKKEIIENAKKCNIEIKNKRSGSIEIEASVS